MQSELITADLKKHDIIVCTCGLCEHVHSLFVCVRVSDKIYFVTVSQSFKGTHCTISLILLAVINLFLFYLQNVTLFKIS